MRAHALEIPSPPPSLTNQFADLMHYHSGTRSRFIFRTALKHRASVPSTNELELRDPSSSPFRLAGVVTTNTTTTDVFVEARD